MQDASGQMVFTRDWYRYLSLFQQQTSEDMSATPDALSPVASPYTDLTVLAAIADDAQSPMTPPELHAMAASMVVIAVELAISRAELADMRDRVHEFSKLIESIQQGVVI
jgi:hypothetical protein